MRCAGTARRSPAFADALRRAPRRRADGARAASRAARSRRGCRSRGRSRRRSPRWSSSAGSRVSMLDPQPTALAKAREAAAVRAAQLQPQPRVAGLPARAPGILADDADPGRRALPARGVRGRRRWPSVDRRADRPDRNDRRASPRGARRRAVAARAALLAVGVARGDPGRARAEDAAAWLDARRRGGADS